MFAIVLVFLSGTTINTLNDHPHSYADVKASLIKQVKHPVIVADYSHLNK